MNRVLTAEHRAKISAAHKGKTLSAEHRAKLSTSIKAAMTPELRDRISTSSKGKVISTETRAKMSVARTGENHWNWKNGASFEPYCYLFNDSKKESIRNRDERTCQLCGKSEILNGRRLSVHHIDGDKMQGCQDKK